MDAFRFVLFMGMIGLACSTFISNDVFDARPLTGRTLLQAVKSCTVNFEFLNYTIITSRCKGPQYAPSLCCPAFTEFACPFVGQINDMTTDCASTMFSYINLYGKYPPGLFAAECKEGKKGLDCKSMESQKTSVTSAVAPIKVGFSVLILMGFVVTMVL